MDEIKTLTAQLDVAEEKLETSRAQAEERLVFPFYLDLYKMLIFFIYFDINRFTLMKSTSDFKGRFQSEEQRRIEEKLRECYVKKLALLEYTDRQLREILQNRQTELQEAREAHTVSVNQYEEQLKRLNDE